VGRDCQKLSIIMSTKTTKTPSTSRQTKRSCLGSDDSDTDHDSPFNFPRWLIIEAAELEQTLSKLSPFVLGKALGAQIGTLKSVKRLYKGDILVETDKATFSKMLLGLTQLAGVPVKVSPHRSLNVSRGLIRSRDIPSCSVEEIFEELRPQGVTAVRDGDGKRRTNTVILDVCFSSASQAHHGRLYEGPCGPLYPEFSTLF